MNAVFKSISENPVEFIGLWILILIFLSNIFFALGVIA
jgi:hypothetical protein